MLTDKQALGFKDVLIQPRPSLIRSREEVILERTFEFKSGKTLTCVPIIASNLTSIGTWTTANILSKYKILTCMHKYVSLESYLSAVKNWPEVCPYVIPTLGLDDYSSLDRLSEAGYNFICLDVANGYMKDFSTFVSNIFKNYPQFTIIAGNVATQEGVYNLYREGAEIVKVGIGSGSVCTTRYKTGVGIPQVTAVNECSNGEAYICSDGGCTSPGDVAKAFVAGADFVMLGGMLSGTPETGYELHGEAFLQKTDDTNYYRTSEGKLVKVPSKGSLSEVIEDILGGLRSCGSYIGEKDIENFYKADLIQVREQTNNCFGEPS